MDDSGEFAALAKLDGASVVVLTVVDAVVVVDVASVVVETVDVR